MKAPAFAYCAVRSTSEVFELLERHGANAKLLAGGQSLVPALNMRLAAPEVLIDISRIDALRGIAVRDKVLRIGALATHREIGESELVRTHAPLLAEAVPYIAHAAIRNVGTIGGSLALADPAAEFPACALALNATIVAASAKGERRIAASHFFKGLYETDLARDEMIVAVEVTPAPATLRTAVLELARRQGDYATVGLAACANVEGNTMRAVRLAYFGVAAKPVLAVAAAKALEGKGNEPAAIRAAQDALANDLQPLGDLYAQPATKLHLARVLAGRAVMNLMQMG